MPAAGTRPGPGANLDVAGVSSVLIRRTADAPALWASCTFSAKLQMPLGITRIFPASLLAEKSLKSVWHGIRTYRENKRR